VSIELERRCGNLARIAASTVPVLVRGETGTGKELVARAVHERSGRRGAFVAINCGALPRSLVESELFGYKRGAFSGAKDDRDGLVRRADHGTLFLDEIAELPEESQVALLRVLQEGEVRPIGAGEVVPVDVRVVAATHQDLAHRIADGRFRQDLYARLAGFEVALVPLRDRREDIGSLVAALLPRITEDASGVTVHRQAARALLGYGYPLNVRELEQALRAAVVLAGGGEIRIEHLPEAMRGVTAPAATVLRPEDRALRERLIEVLREARGNVAAAGRQMNKAPIQIRRWCRRFGIELGGFRG
jgi:transcriptional regulator with PAS, ATPase and Fis domain